MVLSDNLQFVLILFPILALYAIVLYIIFIKYRMDSEQRAENGEIRVVREREFFAETRLPDNSG